MAALTDAMKWYNLGGQGAARLKYHFTVAFYSSQYPNLQSDGRLIFDSVRTVELPKYSIETEVVNAWNVRQLVPTRVNFEPVSITFNDTLDGRFQKFLTSYLNITTGSFQELTKSLRTGLDGSGVRSLEANKDCPIDRVVITRFYGYNNNTAITLWRPKIIDVQHDTLDYSSSEAVTWQISLRYESATYINTKSFSESEPSDLRTAEQIKTSQDLGNWPG